MVRRDFWQMLAAAEAMRERNVRANLVDAYCYLAVAEEVCPVIPFEPINYPRLGVA